MELKGENWENYSTKSGDLSTFSLADLNNHVNNAIRNVEINNKDPHDIPVFIEYDDYKYLASSLSISIGDIMSVSLKAYPYDRLIYTAPDSKPENGEYWSSRGPSSFDCSGFIVSKLAGERLLRMTKYVLDKDEILSWLDFREKEPNWIQFKFSSNEFDLELLDKMSRDAGGIITEDILRKCKI